jgi:GTP cyclohydrolase I
MSRIYSLLVSNLANQTVTNSLLVDLIKKMVDSQMGLSDQAQLSIQFDLPLTRLSLKSELLGHRIYPVQIQVETSGNKISLRNNFEVLYSSTCPASTALSLEIWKEAQAFENSKNWLDGLSLMPATPHAQRSVAKISVELDAHTQWNLEGLIHQAETQLKTPVQSLVKRVDEQEFARLNGQNPMFCEDAARIIQKWLDSETDVLGYLASFEHQESLHSHNAFAQIEKKRPNG